MDEKSNKTDSLIDEKEVNNANPNPVIISNNFENENVNNSLNETVDIIEEPKNETHESKENLSKKVISPIINIPDNKYIIEMTEIKEKIHQSNTNSEINIEKKESINTIESNSYFDNSKVIGGNKENTSTNEFVNIPIENENSIITKLFINN